MTMPDLSRYHTLASSLGLVCLAIYQLTVGEWAGAAGSVCAALGVFGVHKMLGVNIDQLAEHRDALMHMIRTQEAQVRLMTEPKADLHTSMVHPPDGSPTCAGCWITDHD